MTIRRVLKYLLAFLSQFRVGPKRNAKIASFVLCNCNRTLQGDRGARGRSTRRNKRPQTLNIAFRPWRVFRWHGSNPD